jgi:hypothetical protein
MSEDWWTARRDLPDGQIVLVVPMIFGKYRLTIGFDEMTYERGY